MSFDGDKVTREFLLDRLLADVGLPALVGVNPLTDLTHVYEANQVPDDPEAGVGAVDATTGLRRPYIVFYNQSGGSVPLDAIVEPGAGGAEGLDATVWYEADWSVLAIGPAHDKPRLQLAKMRIYAAVCNVAGIATASGFINQSLVVRSVDIDAGDVNGDPYHQMGWTVHIYAGPPLEA
jgi:hypothetical protein